MTTPKQPYGLDPESRQMVVEMVGQLRKRLLTPEKILDFDRREHFPEEELRQMLGPEIGLQLLFIPEAYGGMGGGARDCCAVTRELAKICLGVATAFFAIQLGADPLLVGGTEEQKTEWLGRIAEGRSLVAYAVTEPGAGSNLAALKTRAEAVCDAGGELACWRINGTKQFISTGGYADFMTVLAQTDDGPAFFVVERGTPGLVQGKGEEKHGIRASNTSPLSLDNVEVPAANLIGGVPGEGLRQANQVFGYTRLMVAAMALGAGRAALEIVVPYAKERVQFGTPLAAKQGYTHKLVVPHAVRLAAAEAYIDEVAERLDRGDEGDLQVEGSIAKLFATEAANRLCDDAIQALGGYGYIHEYGVEKIKRDVKITCIYEGTSEIQQSIIGTLRWKVARKTKGAFYGQAADELDALAGTVPDAGLAVTATATRMVNRVIDAAHTHRLVRQQHVLFALADMMTDVEVAGALARRAAGGKDARDRLFARLFARETARRVADRTLAVLVGSGAYTPDAAEPLLAQWGHRDLLLACQGELADLDRAAETLFAG